MTISTKTLFLFIVVSYAIVLAPFLDAGLRNYLVLAAAFVGFVSLFVFGGQGARSLLWTVVLISYMSLVALFTSPTRELASVALTLLYAMGYLAAASFATRPWFDAEFAAKLLGRIVIAFAIVSVIQFVASFSGLPVPNVISSRGVWNYNSLAIEPSHLGRGIGITMLAYLILVRRMPVSGRPYAISGAHAWVLVAFFTTMLLSGSALATLAIPMVFLFGWKPRWVVPLVLIGFLFWPLLLALDYQPLQRALLLLTNLDTLDTAKLVEADASGAARVTPMLVYILEADLGDLGFWFGYGSAGSARFFIERISGIADFGGSVGFFPGFMATYGVAGFLLFLWTFAIRLWNSATLPVFAFWFLFFSSVAWNTQLLWYGLIVLNIVYRVEILRTRYPSRPTPGAGRRVLAQ